MGNTVEQTGAERITTTSWVNQRCRAGLLYGIAHQWSVEKACKLGSLLGSIKIAERGGQNHQVSEAALRERFVATWEEIW